MTREAERVDLRLLTDADLRPLAGVLERVHGACGYPVNLPEDPVVFIRGPRTRRSWVALAGGAPIGHAALAEAHGDRALDLWLEHVPVRAEALTVVKRLFVDPTIQQRGVGRMLLETVVSDAHRQGLWPVLDVDAHNSGAAHLYRSAGFCKVGRVEMRWSSKDGVFLADCYVGPEPPTPPRSKAG